MSWYRRVRTPGGTYFFTVVTHSRRPIFADEKARALLHTAMDEARKRRPFVIDCICLLPDHIHAIWTLPEGDSDYSTRWAQIKGRFSHDFLAAEAGANPAWAIRPPYGPDARVNDDTWKQSAHPTRIGTSRVGDSPTRSGSSPPNVGWAIGPRESPSRARKREVPVWQRRFWEHPIRDEEDYRRHVEYIHFNPVKHGLVHRPIDWEWSSFRRYVREGLYDPTWGEQEPERISKMDGEWGRRSTRLARSVHPSKGWRRNPRYRVE